MFDSHVTTLAETARDKVAFLKTNPLGYFVASLLAGLFVGFGICLVFTIQDLMASSGGSKVVMGFCFSIALTLVVIAGAELFTGNNLIMALGLGRKRVTLSSVVALLFFCWIGNLLGSVLCAALFVGAGGVKTSGAVFISAALKKTELGLLPLFLRGVLCNTLVCLAVWGSGRIEDGAGKILFITLCIATFFISGFEHSVANMTLLSIGLIEGGIPLTGALYNLLVVTLGNLTGGVFLVALPYLLISRKK